LAINIYPKEDAPPHPQLSGLLFITGSRESNKYKPLSLPNDKHPAFL